MLPDGYGDGPAIEAGAVPVLIAMEGVELVVIVPVRRAPELLKP